MIKFMLKLFSTILPQPSAGPAPCPPQNQENEYEANLWRTIQGQSYDFCVSSNWKTKYFDSLGSEDEKYKVKSALLKMLESTEYPIGKKTLIAHVCADLRMLEAMKPVDKLRNETSGSFKYAFTLTFEALSRGVSVPELGRDVWSKAIAECKE